MLPHVWGLGPSGDLSSPGGSSQAPRGPTGGFAGACGLSSQALEDLEDHVRRLVEDCDHLQVQPI